jgi:hypothetical protein
MTSLAAVVDGGALLDVIWVSLIAGVGVVTIFAITLLGATRAADARREGRGAAAVAFGGLAAISLLLFAVVIVVGVWILVS